MKIVLDTNIVVSGLLNSQGNPAQVLALVLAGAVQICHDDQILAEYAEVLARPHFHFDANHVSKVLTKIKTDGLPVDARGQPDLNLPDADDEPFLAVALAASVDFLVTGNLSHYPPDKRRGCLVVSPATFMAAWHKLGGK
jgi:putative PIN family toxin of toxin-antitoxin system